MKNPVRITVALDKEVAELLDKVKKETALSQSEIIRRALRFYHENKRMTEASVRKDFYGSMDMLQEMKRMVRGSSGVLPDEAGVLVRVLGDTSTSIRQVLGAAWNIIRNEILHVPACKVRKY